MKTFKMISFQFENNGQKIPLIDGITINQENQERSWILELFISKQYQSIFETYRDNEEEFGVLVTITSPDNEPAPFLVKVKAIEEIEENLSILLKGQLKTVRIKYAEKLLEMLLDENLSKEDLLDQFIKGMKERPRLK
ncbi:MAG: hypothetical protein GX072_06885 [Lysinibacillus sp.]|nr:hypothetical protein [Lysinibacillus sp.]